MGCFDTVRFKCLKCGEEIRKQSKAGKCNLASYSQDHVPVEIASAIQMDRVHCPKCETEFRVECQLPLRAIPMILRET